MNFFFFLNVVEFCPKSFNYAGKCSNSRNCGLDVNAELGASAMVQNCICQDLVPTQHRCTCCVRCSVTDKKTVFRGTRFINEQLQCKKI